MKIIAQQEIDLWEAWIEFDEFSENNFGILYVLGETESQFSPQMFTLRKLATKRGRLFLELVPLLNSKRKRNREVIFSEPISTIDAYNGVYIVFEGQTISEISEIEVMI